MKKVLITGIEGFVGRHLFAELTSAGEDASILGTSYAEPSWSIPSDIDVMRADVTSKDIHAVFREKGPFDIIFHLAGIASVGFSWKHPEETVKTNTLGTLNLLEAARQTGARPRFVFISSSEVYGTRLNEAMEDSPTAPESPYAVSKLSAENLVLLYGKVYAFPVFIVRPVPHIGPGQSRHFAVMDFCLQGAALKRKKKKEPSLAVGHIDVLKDYCDVRDVVRAYRLIAEKSPPGEIYNISSGKRSSLRDIISIIQESMGFSFSLREDPSRMRPYDPDSAIISSEKVRRLGWSPAYALEETIKDIILSLEEENPRTIK